MDRLAVLGGGVAGALAVTAAIASIGTPEAVLVALVATGTATGACSRSFQSEFRDAFFAGALAWALAVTGIAFGFGGVDAASVTIGENYNAGVLVYVAALGFSVVPGLCAAAGGGLGARLQYTVRDRIGA